MRLKKTCSKPEKTITDLVIEGILSIDIALSVIRAAIEDKTGVD